MEFSIGAMIVAKHDRYKARYCRARQLQTTAAAEYECCKARLLQNFARTGFTARASVVRRLSAREANLAPRRSVTFTLTNVTISVTFCESNLAHEGRLWEVDLKAGASAVPAGGVTTRTRAALGIMLTGTRTGLWGAATGLG
jgi:hypothetical protein